MRQGHHLFYRFHILRSLLPSIAMDRAALLPSNLCLCSVLIYSSSRLFLLLCFLFLSAVRLLAFSMFICSLSFNNLVPFFSALPRLFIIHLICCCPMSPFSTLHLQLDAALQLLALVRQTSDLAMATDLLAVLRRVTEGNDAADALIANGGIRQLLVSSIHDCSFALCVNWLTTCIGRRLEMFCVCN